MKGCGMEGQSVGMTGGHSMDDYRKGEHGREEYGKEDYYTSKDSDAHFHQSLVTDQSS